MNKKRIKLILCILVVVLALSFIYKFYNKGEIDLRKEYNLPENVYTDSAYASVLLHENSEVKHSINKINNMREKRKFDKKLKEKIIDLLNMPLPKQDGPIKFANVETIDKGKYFQNKIIIDTSQITRAHAYLLIPKNVKPPVPAIIAMHGHGNNYYGKEWVVGNIGDSDSFYGKELAERGYVVLVTDVTLFGERSDPNATNRNSYKVAEELAAQALFSLGIPLLGVVVQEDLVALDFLSSLKFVDKEKIGCIGHSFGGTRCNYLAALDNRVKVVAMSNSVAYLISERIIARNWFAILPGLAKYTGKKGLLALIAPRPQIIVYSENDPVFPVEEARDIIKDLTKLYQRLGYENNIKSIYLPNQSHTFPPEAREQVYLFLDQYLKE